MIGNSEIRSGAAEGAERRSAPQTPEIPNTEGDFELKIDGMRYLVGGDFDIAVSDPLPADIEVEAEEMNGARREFDQLNDHARELVRIWEGDMNDLDNVDIRVGPERMTARRPSHRDGRSETIVSQPERKIEIHTSLLERNRAQIPALKQTFEQALQDARSNPANPEAITALGQAGEAYYQSANDIAMAKDRIARISGEPVGDQLGDEADEALLNQARDLYDPEIKLDSGEVAVSSPSPSEAPSAADGPGPEVLVSGARPETSELRQKLLQESMQSTRDRIASRAETISGLVEKLTNNTDDEISRKKLRVELYDLADDRDKLEGIKGRVADDQPEDNSSDIDALVALAENLVNRTDLEQKTTDSGINVGKRIQEARGGQAEQTRNLAAAETYQRVSSSIWNLDNEFGHTTNFTLRSLLKHGELEQYGRTLHHLGEKLKERSEVVASGRQDDVDALDGEISALESKVEEWNAYYEAVARELGSGSDEREQNAATSLFSAVRATRGV